MRVIKTNHDIGDAPKHALRVINEDTFETIHVHLKKGETMSKHHAKCDALILVRSGKVEFEFEKETVVLTNEDVLQMAAYEDHSVLAIEEVDFLIVKVL